MVEKTWQAVDEYFLSKIIAIPNLEDLQMGDARQEKALAIRRLEEDIPAFCFSQ